MGNQQRVRDWERGGGEEESDVRNIAHTSKKMKWAIFSCFVSCCLVSYADKR